MQLQEKRKGHTALSEETVRKVQELYYDDEISRISANKKDCISVHTESGERELKSKRLILHNLKDVYLQFKEKYPNDKIGISKFCELHPKECVTPRIDPLQLLKCLSVLLSPNGGIKSKDEVQRLASLMTKFSKKLVSKCIYVQILKTTDTELLDMFMGAGGWDLLHTWLSDAIVAKNWPLILELLELLLMCPVDVKRLKTNTCPKLIKGLSRDSCNQNARQLAIKLVDQWLKIVKAESYSVPSNDKVHVSASAHSSAGEHQPVVAQSSIQSNVETSSGTAAVIKSEAVEESDNSQSNESSVPETVVLISEDNKPIKVESVSVNDEFVSCNSEVDEKRDVSNSQIKEEPSVENEEKSVSTEQLPVYKITIRDGKQVLATVHGREKVNRKSGSKDEINVKTESEESGGETESVETEKRPFVKTEKSESLKHRAKVEKTDSVSSNESIKESPKSTHKKSKSKHEHKSTEKSDKKLKMSDLMREKSKDSVKNKSKTLSKDKSKSNGDKLKEKEKLKDKDAKGRDKKSGNNSPNYIQDEKDRATLAKLIPPSVSKLGKIPKKPKTEDVQKSVDTKREIDDMKKLTERKSVLPPPSYEPKKPSMSIEVRKPDAARPSTVKTFKSKFRSIGLEEEVKPPPPRKEIKKNAIPLVDKKIPLSFPVKSLPQPVSLKRPSPVKEITPPEKKMKIIDLNVEDTKKEKAGGVKLIPPRPKLFYCRG